MPKIIVDIDDDFYHQTLKHKRLCFEYMGTKELVDAIANGTPLDKIRAEMVKQAEEWKSYNSNSVAYKNIANGLYRAVNIIDRHIWERSE